MKLKTITARNFKGLSFTLHLQPMTVLVGANFAGKTARTDAIRFALLGYLPELGKNARDTFGLSSGKEMEVVAEFDNGLRIQRRLYLKGDTVKTEEEVPEEIKKCGQLAVMLNAEEYFALSPRGRVDYVASNVELGDQWKIPGIAGRVAEIAPKFELALSLDEQTPQQFIEDNIVKAEEKKKAAKAYADRMEKTTQGLAGLRLQDQQAGPPLATLDAQYEQIVREIAALNERKAAGMTSYNTMYLARARRKVINEQLGKTEIQRKDAEKRRERLAEVNRQLAEVPDSSAAIERLQDIISAAKSKRDSAEKTYRENSAAIVKAGVTLAEIDDKTECPYCGATGDGWKALKSAELITEIENLKTAQVQVTHDGKTARESLDNAQRDHEAIRVQSRKTDELQHEQREIERHLATIEGSLGRASALQEELATLAPEDPAIEAAADEIQAALNVKMEEQTDLDTKRKAAAGRANDLKRLAEAEGERDKARVEETAAKSVVEELRRIQTEMVNAAFTPLLEKTNRLFGSILKSPVAYHEGNIGTWRGGVFVGHGTMSGTEKSLIYAALCASLASTSPVRLVMVDELARLDAPNIGKLITACSNAIQAGEIDQFIGIDPRPELYAGVNDSAFRVEKIG